MALRRDFKEAILACLQRDPKFHNAQACRAAYLYELKNTRVTLRVATPSAAVR